MNISTIYLEFWLSYGLGDIHIVVVTGDFTFTMHMIRNAIQTSSHFLNFPLVSKWPQGISDWISRMLRLAIVFNLGICLYACITLYYKLNLQGKSYLWLLGLRILSALCVSTRNSKIREDPKLDRILENFMGHLP